MTRSFKHVLMLVLITAIFVSCVTKEEYLIPVTGGNTIPNGQDYSTPVATLTDAPTPTKTPTRTPTTKPTATATLRPTATPTATIMPTATDPPYQFKNNINDAPYLAQLLGMEITTTPLDTCFKEVYLMDDGRCFLGMGNISPDSKVPGPYYLGLFWVQEQGSKIVSSRFFVMDAGEYTYSHHVTIDEVFDQFWDSSRRSRAIQTQWVTPQNFWPISAELFEKLSSTILYQFDDWYEYY